MLIVCIYFNSYRRDPHQTHSRQAHSILATMQVNVSRCRYEPLYINGVFLEYEVDSGSVSNETWRNLVVPGKVLFFLKHLMFQVMHCNCRQRWNVRPPSKEKPKPRYAICLIVISTSSSWTNWHVLEPKIQTVTCQQMRIKETMKCLAAVLEDTLGTCTRTTARLFLRPGANCMIRPKRSVLIAVM